MRTVKRRRPKRRADKAPAYQWYPKDAKTDERYLLMTPEERGVYRDLLDHQWLHGSVPNDIPAMAACAGNITPDRLAIIWPKIEGCFIVDATAMRLVNARLEKQRAEFLNHQRTQTIKGVKGAAKRWEAKRIAADGRGMNRALPGNSSASASAPASAITSVVKNTTEGPPSKPSKQKPKGPDLLSDPTERTQVDALITEWNTLRRPGPRVMVSVPDKRRDDYGRALRAMPNLADWRIVIGWLNGERWANAPGTGDHPSWRASLDWLTKPGKLAEHLERARLDASDHTERKKSSTCPHTPTCERSRECIQKIIDEGRAERAAATAKG